jgi:alcohol dehydrogenase class IV
VVLVADRALVELGVAGRLTAALEAAGAEVALFADVDGEPSQAQVEAATDFVRFNAAGLVVCLGGGSAMDIGKVAATIASTGDVPADFAMEARPLHKRPVPKICLPTTGHRLRVLLDQHLHQPGRQEGLGLGARDQARARDPRPRADHDPAA